MAPELDKINYAMAGVDIGAADEVVAKIKEILEEEGIVAEGLFGGAIDITHLKDLESVPVGIVTASIVEDEDDVAAGTKTVDAALDKVAEGTTPIAILNYFAGLGMDVNEVPEFVRGVAVQGARRNALTIGGENAEMPGIYNKGKRDAYVHVVTHGPQGKTVDIASLIKGMEKPLLCGTTDGTGTKTKHVRDPIDIICHGSNDLGAMGVRPAACAIYVAGNAPLKELEAIAAKSQESCETVGITALDATVEHKPDEYAPGQVDIAGTVIGVVDAKNLITGKGVAEGDVIIGLATDCLMTNGYSLARKYCEETEDPQDDDNLPGLEGTTINYELSKPHTSYTDILFGTQEAEGILSRFKGQVKATAHITGKGQEGNIKRMVPDGLCAVVKKFMLPWPPIVQYFRTNNASLDYMYEAFNMGVGFTLTVSPDIADEVVKYINDTFRNSIPGVSRAAAKIGKLEPSDDPTEKFRWEAD